MIDGGRLECQTQLEEKYNITVIWAQEDVKILHSLLNNNNNNVVEIQNSVRLKQNLFTGLERLHNNGDHFRYKEILTFWRLTTYMCVCVCVCVVPHS